MTSRPLRCLPAVLAALLVAGCGDRGYQGTVMQPVLAVPDIALAGAGGDTVSFARTGGKLTLVTFGYTSCPDVCPTTLSRWREARQALGPDTASVRFVFVSGDWRHDTPEATTRFARTFDAAFHGVTADSATLRRLLPVFQAEVGYGGPPGSANAGFAHSDFDYLVDEKGRVSLWYPFNTRPETFVGDLRRMLREHRQAKA